MTSSRRPLSLAGRLALAALSGFGALILAELAVRCVKPNPPIQIVRPRPDLRLTTLHGEPIWMDADARRDFSNAGCPAVRPAAPRVAFFGDSIFSIGMAPPENVFSKLLQNKFDARSAGGPCIMNFSYPNYSFGAKFARAQDELPKYRPQLVYWGIWRNEPLIYTMIGGTAYTFDDIEAPKQGWLFTHSRLYEHAALVLARKKPDDHAAARFERYVHDRLPVMADLVRRSGGKLVLVFCPPLDRSFEESARGNFWEFEGYRRVMDYAKANHIPYIRLDEAFAGQDYLRIRNDSCCHYNNDGHALMAELFYKDIPARLRSRP